MITLTYYKKSKANPLGGWDVAFKWFRKDKSVSGKTKIRLATKDLKDLQTVLNEKFN